MVNKLKEHKIIPTSLPVDRPKYTMFFPGIMSILISNLP